jgi:hypothetical protein
VIEQARSQFAAMIFAEQTPPLAPAHRQLLEHVYRDMLSLDLDCLSSLTRWPLLVRAALPYAAYGANSETTGEGNFVPSGSARTSLADQFTLHPALPIIIETAIQLGDRLETADPPPAVVHLQHQIEQTPPGQVRGATAAFLAGLMKPGSSEWTLLRHLLALVCMRASLSVLNQLVYQRARDDKLVFLDGRNLSAFSEASDAFSPRRYEASMQPQRENEDRVQLGDLVLLDVRGERQLCRSENLTWNVDAAGYDVQLRLRPVGEDLNPYPRLLAQLTRNTPADD